MKVLVTGAGGFIGSHLVEQLLALGYTVRALARYNGRGSSGHLEEISDTKPGQLDIRLGDITDSIFVRDLVAGCDVVCHLAALIAIPYSYHAPSSYVATNIGGTLNVLDACRGSGVKRVIVTSTSEVYGTAQYTPIDEQHPLQGQSPYSASKIGADKLAESFYRSFDVPVVTLRPFNTYGPRQSARAIIPTVLSQALAGYSEIRLGNLSPLRDLTFVDDTARAFCLAIEKPRIEGETIHFGQGQAITIGDLAKKCLESVGSSASIVATEERTRPEKSEVGVLLCNPKKSERLLSWKPTISLETGLERAADYIRRNLARYKTGEYTI